MKKTFALTHPKIKPARLIESIKHEVKKYIKRERSKTLPEDADYWDFDCKYGKTQDDATAVHLSEINKYIDQASADGLESFYLEVLVKEANRHFEIREEAEPTPELEDEAGETDDSDENSGEDTDSENAIV